MFFDKVSTLLLAGSSSLLPSILPDRVSSSATAYNKTSDKKFFWDNIVPNDTLQYHDCFSDFKCARLQVPMDWTNLSDPRTVEIAVIRLPATVPITSANYGGPVIINPGGPGGSGVDLALKEAKSIQTVLSAGPDASNDTARYFDIISFDPRGVNNTTPYFTCFPDSVQMHTFQLEESATGAFDSSDASFGLHWARVGGLGKDCSQRALESGIGEFVTTASVARDIVEIAERHGEWRDADAKKLLSSPASSLHRRGLQMPIVAVEQAEVMKRTKYTPGEELIQYWGFSYGTILGATLAAMFPEKMGRVALDGVADSFDYMKGGWRSNLQDTDMLILKFGDYCWLGGPDNCALYHEDGPTVIVSQFMAIVDDLKQNPIGVPASVGYTAGVATYGDLKQLFWSTTYRPLKEFHKVARIMKELSQGNGTGLIQQKREKSKALAEGLTDKCKTDGPYSRACFETPGAFDISSSNGAAILCTDAEDQTNMTKDEYWQYTQELIAQSRLIGDVWAVIRLPCTQWNIRPKWRYEGNFTATTAHPILFISNSFDNVCPLRNGIRMSKGFAGSVVLQQDSEGHCSGSSVSFCTARAVRKYFQTGELPKKGTLCAPDRLPLDGFSEEKDPKIPEGETDEELWKAMVQMALR